MTPEQQIRSDTPRPFTGAEYIESLRDGREVYIDGERVRFSHPLVASIVYSRAIAPRRRVVHRRLAQVVTDPEQRLALVNIPEPPGLRRISDARFLL